jgi:hypothetical protein
VRPRAWNRGNLAETAATLYAFGLPPDQPQFDVLDSVPGEPDYSPWWQVVLVMINDDRDVSVNPFTSEEEILAAADAGEVVLVETDFVFLCQVLPGGGLTKNANQFVAPMSGDQEVPPVDSNGTGNTVFQLSEDGDSLHYQLIVANTENVTQAHIHLAPAGENGPVVVFLFGFVDGGVTQNGVLAEGTITEADLIPRPGIGFDGTLESLLAEMHAGNAYVNVHTVAYPPGEIRGQIMPAGPR